MYLIVTNLKGVSSMKLARDLGITQKSAWHMSHRLHKALEDGKSEFLSGIMEVDETYVGGKERNKHDWKKQRMRGGLSARLRWSESSKETDEHRFYTALSKQYEHATVSHGAGEYLRGIVHTNSVEPFWFIFKRGHYGTAPCLHTSREHLDRCSSKFFGRKTSGKNPPHTKGSIYSHNSLSNNTAYTRLANQIPGTHLVKID